MTDGPAQAAPEALVSLFGKTEGSPRWERQTRGQRQSELQKKRRRRKWAAQRVPAPKVRSGFCLQLRAAAAARASGSPLQCGLPVSVLAERGCRGGFAEKELLASGRAREEERKSRLQLDELSCIYDFACSDLSLSCSRPSETGLAATPDAFGEEAAAPGVPFFAGTPLGQVLRSASPPPPSRCTLRIWVFNPAGDSARATRTHGLPGVVAVAAAPAPIPPPSSRATAASVFAPDRSASGRCLESEKASSVGEICRCGAGRRKVSRKSLRR